MSEERPKNKLSIYLIKPEITRLNQLVEDGFEDLIIDEGATLCVSPSRANTPDWIRKFFISEATAIGDLGIFTAAAKAVLIVQGVGEDNRIFAVCFGYGKHMLKPGVIEERFGLKTTINIVDQNNLRSIDKTFLGSVPKHSKEQISQDGDKESFGLNIEQDLVRAISGKPRSSYDNFGKIVSGKDALYITAQVDTSNLQSMLTQCLERYKSDDYKENFDWIDQIAEIQDRALISKLNDKLIERLQNDNRDKLWMATPEEVDWSDIKGFIYHKPNNSNLFEDLHISALMDLFENRELTLNKLKLEKIYAISAATDSEKYRWSAYQCLYFEIEENGSTYMLTNGKWYEIDQRFVTAVKRDYNAIPRRSTDFPDYTDEHKNENAYNEFLARTLNGACLDGDNISYGGGYSKIEFCDVFSNEKEIIHVKHYSGSSTLSHLFAQGAVSGETYVSDPEFRTKVNEKMPENLQLSNPNTKYKPNDQKIVFAVIARNQGDLDLPFFSKVSLRNARSRLLGFGYSVELVKVHNTTVKVKT